MLFGPCKCCVIKEAHLAEQLARISDLKEEIAFLRKQVAPVSPSGFLPQVHVEADRIISGSEVVSPEHREEQLRIENEANALLTGSY